jgi:hypothetical protein
MRSISQNIFVTLNIGQVLPLQPKLVEERILSPNGRRSNLQYQQNPAPEHMSSESLLKRQLVVMKTSNEKLVIFARTTDSLNTRWKLLEYSFMLWNTFVALKYKPPLSSSVIDGKPSNIRGISSGSKRIDQISQSIKTTTMVIISHLSDDGIESEFVGFTPESQEGQMSPEERSDEIPRIFDGLRWYKNGVIVFQSNERISKHKGIFQKLSN